MEFKKVHYYTIRLENKPCSEYSDFLTRMNNERDAHELGEINRYIQQIGKRYGALPVHFKNEDAAERLPPPYHQFIETHAIDDYGLRLYCIRLCPSIVILLNGDRKTAQKVQHCRNCYKHFNLARKLSIKITQAIEEDDMAIEEESRSILLSEDFDLEL